MLPQSLAAVTFPMLYVNSVPHQGHGALIARCQLMARFLSLRKPTKLMAGFHCTGRPVVLSVQRYHEGAEREVASVNEAARICGRTAPVITEDSWVELMVEAGRRLFEKLGLSIDHTKDHKTARFDGAYELFVAQFFTQLLHRGYLVRKDHHTLWSDRTAAPVGDHQLRRGQSARIIFTTLNCVPYDQQHDIFVAGGSLQEATQWPHLLKLYLTTGRPVWVSPYLAPTLFERGLLKAQTELQLTVPGGRDDVSIPHPPQPQLQPGEEALIFQPVVTREGEIAKVKLIKDAWHIDYGAPDWKQLTRKHILRKRLSAPARATLLHCLQGLHAWSVERTVSIGTSLKLDNDRLVPCQPEQALLRNIDSLSDSGLFMFYAFYRGPTWSQPSQEKVLYITAKDLLPNHVLFHLYAEALFGLDFTEIHVVGYLLAQPGKKISKSQGRQLFLSELVDTYGPRTSLAVLGTALKPDKDAYLTDKSIETIEKLLRVLDQGVPAVVSTQCSPSVQLLFFAKILAVVEAYQQGQLGTLPGLFFAGLLPELASYEGYLEYLECLYSCFSPFSGHTTRLKNPYLYLRQKAKVVVALGLDSTLLRDTRLLHNLLKTAEAVEAKALWIPSFLAAYKTFVEVHTGKSVQIKEGIGQVEANTQVLSES